MPTLEIYSHPTESDLIIIEYAGKKYPFLNNTYFTGKTVEGHLTRKDEHITTFCSSWKL